MDKIRNIDELIRLLYSSIGLLSQLYEHRNSFLYKDALDLVDRNSKKLENLFQYGIIEQSDDEHIEISSIHRRYFEDVTQSNVEISGSKMDDFINEAKKFIKVIVTIRDNNGNNESFYISKLRAIFGDIAYSTKLSGESLSFKVEETYTTEKNFEVKMVLLEQLRESIEDIRNSIYRLYAFLDKEDYILHQKINNPRVSLSIEKMKLSLSEVDRELFFLRAKLYRYIGNVKEQSEKYYKVKKLCALYKNHLHCEQTNIEEVFMAIKPVFLEGRSYVKSLPSIDQLTYGDNARSIIRAVKERMNAWKETEEEYKAKAVSIKREISSLNVKIAGCEDNMRKLKNAKADFNRKLLDYRNNKKDGLSVEKCQVEDMIASNERSLKTLKESLDEELEKVKNDIAKSRKEALESKNKMLADIENCIREKDDEIQKSIEEAKAILEKKILDGGCDLSIRKSLEEKIQTLNKRLEEAENMRHNLSKYDSVKETFFDEEPSRIKQLSINKEQLRIVEDNFKEIISGLENQIGGVEKELKSLNDRAADIVSARNDYQLLLNMYGDKKYFRCREEEKSSKSASEIISFLNKTIPFIERSKINIVQDINNFMIGFPENNSFGFNNEGIGTEEGEARLDYFINKLYEALGVDTEKEREITLSQSFSHVFARISRDVKNLYQHKGHVQKIINELNQDFLKENFVNALKELRFEMEDSDDKLIRLLIKIQSFYDENQSSIGDCGLFSTSDYDMKVVADSISILNTLQKALVNEGRMVLDIKDTFRIKIHIKENENKLDFTDSIPTVSSTGINLLTKAIINIMLINVFKKKIKSSDDVFVHCMIDEVGRLDNGNAAGVLVFANNRKIWIITDAPEPKTLKKYKHTYTLSKDGRGKTHVIRAYSEMP